MSDNILPTFKINWDEMAITDPSYFIKSNKTNTLSTKPIYIMKMSPLQTYCCVKFYDYNEKDYKLTFVTTSDTYESYTEYNRFILTPSMLTDVCHITQIPNTILNDVDKWINCHYLTNVLSCKSLHETLTNIYNLFLVVPYRNSNAIHISRFHAMNRSGNLVFEDTWTKECCEASRIIAIEEEQETS